MFKLTKHAFIALLSFSETLATKCIPLSKETCKIRPTLINLNPLELKYYPLMISLEKCSGSCNSVNDLYRGIYVFYIKRNINVKVFNMMTNKNEAKAMVKHISCDCKCKFKSKMEQ